MDGRIWCVSYTTGISLVGGSVVETGCNKELVLMGPSCLGKTRRRPHFEFVTDVVDLNTPILFRLNTMKDLGWRTKSQMKTLTRVAPYQHVAIDPSRLIAAPCSFHHACRRRAGMMPQQSENGFLFRIPVSNPNLSKV